MNLTYLFFTISLANGLPLGLLDSVCYVETGHNVNAVHKQDGNGNSYGLCQIKEATARQMGFKGKIQDLMQPRTNIFYASLYLKYQLARYKGNYARAITAYNKGNSSTHGGSEYLAKVFNQWIINQSPQRGFSLAGASH